VLPADRIEAVRGLPVKEAAARLRVSIATAYRWLSQKTPSNTTPEAA
jgi:transposase